MTDHPDGDQADLDPETISDLRDLGGTALLDDLASLFREDVDRYLDGFARTPRDHDPMALRRASHTFKGNSANLGAVRLAEIAGRIERLGEAGDLDGAKSLQPGLTSLCRRALDALSAETRRSLSSPQS